MGQIRRHENIPSALRRDGSQRGREHLKVQYLGQLPAQVNRARFVMQTLFRHRNSNDTISFCSVSLFKELANIHFRKFSIEFILNTSALYMNKHCKSSAHGVLYSLLIPTSRSMTG